MRATRPLMATGKIVDDYTLLEAYWKIVKEKNPNKDVIKSTYLDKAIEILTGQDNQLISVNSIVETLASVIKDDVDKEAALEALKSTRRSQYKDRDAKIEEITAEEAMEHISRIIAGYIVEILDSLGKIKIKVK